MLSVQSLFSKWLLIYILLICECVSLLLWVNRTLCIILGYFEYTWVTAVGQIHISVNTDMIISAALLYMALERRHDRQTEVAVIWQWMQMWMTCEWKWRGRDAKDGQIRISVKFKNVKFILEQAMHAQRGGRGVALLINVNTRWGWVVSTTPCPGCFTLKRSGAHCMRGWMTAPHWDSIPWLSSL